ncbi:MAG: D-alanyl-D-alanine carboxypeptidase, partial [bacterium]|nr:D-alanyl-D-alanine carboxypeptidase [bacterium]
YEGGEAMFINKMNGNALNFKLENTHFTDSIGLDQKNYTTSHDLARLASVALKNKVFADIVSTKNKVITDVSQKKVYILNNLNQLLGKDGVNGVKTGFTEEAQGVLVTSRKNNNHTLIIVVIKSKDRFFDTQELLSLVGVNIQYLEF